jgi:hypothetical protein
MDKTVSIFLRIPYQMVTVDIKSLIIQIETNVTTVQIPLEVAFPIYHHWTTSMVNNHYKSIRPETAASHYQR